MTKAKELYDLLNSHLSQEDNELSEKDLSYEETPDENVDINTIFPKGKEGLAFVDFVCCEQKIIYWDETENVYLISCLYNSHETMKYPTASEVMNFLKGYTDGKWFVDYEKGMTKEKKAFEDGVYCNLKEQVEKNSFDYNKNVLPDSITYN